MSAEPETLAARPHTTTPATRVDLVELPKWRRRVTLTVPAERVGIERRRITREYASRAKIPGFRPGKAPADLVRKRFHSEIEGDLVRSLLQAGIRESLAEHKLEPISPPGVRSADLDAADIFRATVEIEVRPEITLSRYRGFRLERPVAALAPEAVDRVLSRLRDERAEVRPVDRPAERGDVVVADVEPAEGGGSVQAHEILLGSATASPEVEEQLQGVRAGEERVVVVQPPAGEPAGTGTEAASRSSASWRVRVHEVRERLLPELDDAFAAEVSGAATLAELREKIAEELRREAAARAEAELRERLLDAIAEANAIEVPDSMVARAVERMLLPDREGGGHEGRPGRDSHGGHGHPHRTELGEREAELAEVLRPVAERSLRRAFIVDAVARAEGLDPSEEQIETYLRARVDPGIAPEQARHSLERAGRLDELRSHLRAESVFEYLKGQSTIREVNDRSPVEPTG